MVSGDLSLSLSGIFFSKAKNSRRVIDCGVWKGVHVLLSLGAARLATERPPSARTHTHTLQSCRKKEGRGKRVRDRDRDRKRNAEAPGEKEKEKERA